MRARGACVHKLSFHVGFLLSVTRRFTGNLFSAHHKLHRKQFSGGLMVSISMYILHLCWQQDNTRLGRRTPSNGANSSACCIQKVCFLASAVLIKCRLRDVTPDPPPRTTRTSSRQVQSTQDADFAYGSQEIEACAHLICSVLISPA